MGVKDAIMVGVCFSIGITAFRTIVEKKPMDRTDAAIVMGAIGGALVTNPDV